MVSCEDPGYLIQQFPVVLPVQEVDDRIYSISDFIVDKQIDVVLVVDNSGSMGPIQKSVVDNAELFFSKFAKDNTIDWKLGIVSTDQGEDPYLGFEESFDAGLVDPTIPGSFENAVGIFQNAMGKLGVGGDYLEYTFFNLKRHVDNYSGHSTSRPSFLRQNAHLVVIMISDEEEQSAEEFGKAFEAENFFDKMRTYVASDRVLRFYGAIKHPDLRSCPSGFGDPWQGSEFERIINLSSGFVISACIQNFGDELARIGEDIANLIEPPRLLLKRRPKVETLKVFYEEEEIPAGAEEEGGLWYYEEITNTINFYNINFVKDPENDRFRVDFDVDDGINRKYE